MADSRYNLDRTSVLFLTLDCCRYDTFKQAKLPFLKSIGKVRKAKTHGTYTLPAHMSFFSGYLPIVAGSLEPYYAPDVRQLWRLRSGRPRDLDSVGILLDGKNILEGYRKLGFITIGTGGVRWFTNPTLSKLFDKFVFFGPQTKNVFSERKYSDFSLNHIPDLLRLIGDNSKYFLFVNCLETHVPYDFGEGLYSPEVRKIIRKAMPMWGCKKQLDKIRITQKELKKLHAAQIKSLESVDHKIEALVSFLKKPLLLVVCGDHGECFGENMLWGHGYAASKVMDVPLLITTVF